MATKKRETSDRVSRIAARLLRAMKARPWLTVLLADDFTQKDITRNVKALAASCLNQDQTKGKRPAKRMVKRRG
jgi:hypothetical protein